VATLSITTLANGTLSVVAMAVCSPNSMSSNVNEEVDNPTKDTANEIRKKLSLHAPQALLLVNLPEEHSDPFSAVCVRVAVSADMVAQSQPQNV
jgi:hypothetical protein